MKPEIWKPVVAYEGLYEVSNQGKVRSLTRTVVYTNNGRYSITRKRTVLGQILNVFIDKEGRRSVNLCKNNTSKSHRIHRLILLAFVGFPKPGQEGCHWDGDLSNNSLENLRWDTRSENMKDAVRHGTRYYPDNRGEKGPGAKLTKVQVIQIRLLHSQGFGIRELGREFNVSHGTVGHIVRRKTWTDVP